MTEITEGYGFRGRTIIDLDGEKIGKIDDVYVHRRRYVVTDPKDRVRLGTDERTDQETISETLRKERIETDDDARA
jgi:sporulation protein YlmC with PRC-barrel domain